MGEGEGEREGELEREWLERELAGEWELGERGGDWLSSSSGRMPSERERERAAKDSERRAEMARIQQWWERRSRAEKWRMRLEEVWMAMGYSLFLYGAASMRTKEDVAMVPLGVPRLFLLAK